MRVDGQPYRTVWAASCAPAVVRLIDQRHLPWRLVLEDVRSLKAAAAAIRDMHVRGAGCIGATAAYGLWLAAETGVALDEAAAVLKATRPTAVNLAWAVERMLARGVTLAEADAIADEDVAACQAIGRHGLGVFEHRRTELGKGASDTLNVLTHCNAGWLAFVDHGSALAPVYAAHDAGLPVHVWVDETRPRNQGARLTAWELAAHGVPHTVISDNAGGHLMQRGLVDLVIVGADRVTRSGDVANKIGTYLKAVAARDCGVPFYVAFPSSTLDSSIDAGAAIPIEERAEDEIALIDGPRADGVEETIRLVPPGTRCANPAFDVTPARLITGLITETGVSPAPQSGTINSSKVSGHRACSSGTQSMGLTRDID